MKKIISTLLVAFTIVNGFGQTVQGSIKPVSLTASTVIITINPSVTSTTRIGSATLCVAVPVSASPSSRPPLTIDNSANTSIVYVQQDGTVQPINGIDHYIYNLIGTGSVTNVADDHTYTAGNDNELVRVSFQGDGSLTSKIKLVNLPDGGPTSYSFFALTFLGTDVANEAAQFYAIPTISTATNDGNGYSGTSFSETTGLVPLPVKFTGFSVTKKDNAGVLNWLIANENATIASYEVQRSTNGTDFSSIASVSPKNNGSINSYDLTDANLLSLRSSGGVIYYRIKQLDKDGRSTFSETKSLRLKGNGISIAAFPNPTRAATSLSLDLVENAPVNIKITDAAGKELKQIQLQGAKGLNVQKIDMSSFAAGSYLLKVQAGVETKTLSIVKSN